MPLRKSPRLTPALLAANRRNARKSTGPRTGAHLLRRGSAAQLAGFDRGGFLEALSRMSLAQQLEFSRLYAALLGALDWGPQTSARLLPAAISLWRTKCAAERQVRRPAFRRWVKAHGGFLPFPMRILRPWEGSTGASVTLVVRPGRARASAALDREGQWDGRCALHVGVFIYRSNGREWRRFGVTGWRALRRQATAGPATARGSTQPTARPAGRPARPAGPARPVRTARVTLLGRLRRFFRGSGASEGAGAE